MTNKPLWQRQKLRRKALGEPAICPDDKFLSQRRPRSAAVGSISFPGAAGAPAIYPLPGRTIYICTANPRRVQEMKFLVKHIHRAHENPLPPSPSQAARVLPPPSRGRSSLPESWSKSRQRLPDFKLQSQSLRFCRGGTQSQQQGTQPGTGTGSQTLWFVQPPCSSGPVLIFQDLKS